MSDSPIDEVRCTDPTSVALSVFHEVRSRGYPLHFLVVLFEELVRHILVSEFEDVFTLTADATPGTAKPITLTFNADLFRQRLTASANQRVAAHSESPAI